MLPKNYFDRSKSTKTDLTDFYIFYIFYGIREFSGIILSRGPKFCKFIEWRGYKVVYRKYVDDYICMCVNHELEILEIIHHYVVILDRYFENVCELDLVSNFHKEFQESNKRTIGRLIDAQDALEEAAKEEASSIRNIIAQATKNI
ncbi:hypothetical protein Pfo_005442 [Paulownia fortunei]|nr:hypothetical protein Pfo_005442 [Paulownia fortunei]